MLKRLILTNWLCHRSQTIDFDRYITVLVGRNGVGKSAIVHALKWLALGEWPGKADAFITWGETFTEVSLQTAKNLIVRHKGQDSNAYILNGRTLKFDSVLRRGVPDMVRRAVNLTADNFQSQREMAFWLDLTSGQAAKALNKIINLDAIDHSLTNIASELRLARARETVCVERVESAAKLTESLAWTVQAHRDMCTIEQYEADITQKGARIASIERLLLDAAGIAWTRDNALALCQQLKLTLSLDRKAAELQVRLGRLQAVVSRFKSMEERKCQIQKKLAPIRAKIASLLVVCPLCKRAAST